MEAVEVEGSFVKGHSMWYPHPHVKGGNEILLFLMISITLDGVLKDVSTKNSTRACVQQEAAD